MTTAVEAVDAYLQRDPTLADTVSRGLARVRRTARWLIEENEWDLTEDAVVSALRRYDERHPGQPFARPRQLLCEGRVELRRDLALLAVPRTHDIQQNSLEAWASGDVRDTLGILPSRTTLKVLIEEAALRPFCGALARDRVKKITSPVSLVEVKFGVRSADLTVFALILSALAHHQIEVVEVLSCSPSCSVIVRDGDGRRAFDVLSDLTT